MTSCLLTVSAAAFPEQATGDSGVQHRHADFGIQASKLDARDVISFINARYL